MRFRIRTIGPILTGVALLFAASSCADVEGDTQSSDNAALGDALPGTNGTTFAAAKANFAAQEGAPDGLGPIFNERSCMLCHQTGAVGGAGENIERRYGTLTNGVFDPLANTGGSLRQLFSLGVFTVGNGQNCQSGTDANPGPGRDDLRGSRDDAALRPRPRRLAARLGVRHARQPRAGRHPRHRQPGRRPRCRTLSIPRRPPAAPASAASAGRRACPTWGSSRPTPT